MANIVDVPIFSTVDNTVEMIAPCNTSNSGGNPVLYVEQLPANLTLSVYSLNASDDSWEYCKFKDGNDMIITHDTSKQIIMEKGNYRIKCEASSDDAITSLPKVRF